MKISLAKFAVLLGALLVARYGLVLVGVDAFVLRDFNSFGYPLAAYLHDSFWEAEIPLWNPYNHCGLPYLAQWNTMVCYPPSLIYCLLPVSWAINVFCLLHLYAAGLGMFVLARRWVEHEPAALLAGLAYPFSGLLINSLMWPNNIVAFGCLPWVIWATDRALEGDRRQVAIAVLLGALQMLSGAPEVILATWTIIGVVWLTRFKTGFSRLALIVVGVATVSMIQLLPFFELLRFTGRDAETAQDGWSVPWHFWANYLAPLFRVGGPPDGTLYLAGQSWTHSHYAGVGALLLAFLGVVFVRERRVRALALLTVIAMLLALGRKGYLFALLDSIGPIALMRYPVKFLIVPTVLAPLLAAYGLRSLLTLKWPRIRTPLAVTVAVLMAGFATVAWMIPRSSGEFARNELAWRSWVIAVVVLGVVVGWITFHRNRTASVRSISLLLGVLVVDLILHHPSLSPTVPRALWTEPVPVGLDGRAPKFGEGRIAITPGAQYTLLYRPAKSLSDSLIGWRVGLPANMNLVSRTPRVEGFYSIKFTEVFEVQKKLYTDVSTLRQPVADFLGVRQYLVDTNGFSWRENQSALPLITAGQAPIFTTNNIPTLLTAEDYDPRRFVILSETERQHVTAATNVSASVSNIILEHHRISFVVDTPEPTLAVIAQAHYPAWSATLDGREEVRLLPANGAFQALAIPAGRHLVELVYRDSQFHLGAGISLLALLATLGIGFLFPTAGAEGTKNPPDHEPTK